MVEATTLSRPFIGVLKQRLYTKDSSRILKNGYSLDRTEELSSQGMSSMAVEIIHKINAAKIK
jgi:hypothetical protein